VSIVEKMFLKYLGTPDHPLAKTIMETVRNGTEVVVESYLDSSQHGTMVRQEAKVVRRK
jgi:hypothetical protein